MQGDQQNTFPENRRLHISDQMGSGYSPDRYIPSFFGQHVDFQPSRDCPRNFVIFDRTDNRSQIMYNPATASEFGYCGVDVTQKDVNAPGVMHEDLADIDALLSFDEEEEEEDEHEEEDYEEDEVSTARMEGHDVNDTCDSCSSRSKEGEIMKREKMRKMMKSIRGIVPNGNNRKMNTVDVLDEAVKYLKSLKVEAQKMGVGDLLG